MLRKLTYFLSAWRRERHGTTAIEFALMAIPYLMLSLGIIELAIMYAAGTLLDGATGYAARLIRTGQLQQMQNVNPEDIFRQAICNYATVLIRRDDVIVEARTLNGYEDYANAQPVYDEDGNLVSQGFTIGGSNDVVLVRVAYRYTMMTPFIGMLLAGPTNSRLFMSTVVMQTEPYQF